MAAALPPCWDRLFRVNGTEQRRLWGSGWSPGETGKHPRKRNWQGDAAALLTLFWRRSLAAGAHRYRVILETRSHARCMGEAVAVARCVRGASAVPNQHDGLSTRDARCVVLWYDTHEEY